MHRIFRYIVYFDTSYISIYRIFWQIVFEICKKNSSAANSKKKRKRRKSSLKAACYCTYVKYGVRSFNSGLQNLTSFLYATNSLCPTHDYVRRSEGYCCSYDLSHHPLTPSHCLLNAHPARHQVSTYDMIWYDMIWYDMGYRNRNRFWFFENRYRIELDSRSTSDTTPYPYLSRPTPKAMWWNPLGQPHRPRTHSDRGPESSESVSEFGPESDSALVPESVSEPNFRFCWQAPVGQSPLVLHSTFP